MTRNITDSLPVKLAVLAIVLMIGLLTATNAARIKRMSDRDQDRRDDRRRIGLLEYRVDALEKSATNKFGGAR